MVALRRCAAGGGGSGLTLQAPCFQRCVCRCSVATHPIADRVRKTDMNAPLDPRSPPAQPSAGGARAIRRRLLERVADADPTHLTINADQGGWQNLLDGIGIKVLHERDGVMSYLLRLAPGARLPAHRHPIDEEGIVLEGTLRVGTRLEIGPGSYHRAHQGALHACITTPTGATIFLRGAAPSIDQVLE